LPTPGGSQHLQWDEENIDAAEKEKEATTRMTIDEPKTPFVRYNAETDTVEGDIPSLDLYGRHIPEGGRTQSPTGESEPQSPSSPRRPSISGRSSGGSSAGSRSTSFNLPDEARRTIHLEDRDRGGEVSEDDEMDEEAAAAKHAAFVRARGRHYSNEAEAMKRAQKLLEEEDDESSAADTNEATEDDDKSAEGVPPVPPLPSVNGVHRPS